MIWILFNLMHRKNHIISVFRHFKSSAMGTMIFTDFLMGCDFMYPITVNQSASHKSSFTCWFLFIYQTHQNLPNLFSCQYFLDLPGQLFK